VDGRRAPKPFQTRPGWRLALSIGAFSLRGQALLKLHDEISWIVSHAWSFRFLLLAPMLSGAEAILPLISNHQPLPPRIFAAATFLIVAAATVARLVAQKRPPRAEEGVK
jgi:hypothetical protein